MKKSIAKLLAASCCVAALALPAAAHALDNTMQYQTYNNQPLSQQAPGNAAYTSQTTTATSNSNANDAQRQASYNRVNWYNYDSEARNRGDNNTGANMGPGGRNSGFDDNDALHSSGTRHINDTMLDGSDNYNAPQNNNPNY